MQVEYSLLTSINFIWTSIEELKNTCLHSLAAVQHEDMP